jgi:hypothetical protein
MRIEISIILIRLQSYNVFLKKESIFEQKAIELAK